MEEKSTEEYRDFLRNYLLLKEQLIREPDNFESFRHLIHKYGEEIPLSEMLELMDLADQRYGESSPEKLTELVEMVFEKNRYEIKVDNLIEEVKEVFKELNVKCYQHEPHWLVAFVADKNHYHTVRVEIQVNSKKIHVRVYFQGQVLMRAIPYAAMGILKLNEKQPYDEQLKMELETGKIYLETCLEVWREKYMSKEVLKEQIEKLCKTAFCLDYYIKDYKDGRIASLSQYFVYKEIMKEAVFLTFYEKEMTDTKVSFGIQEAIDREKDIEKIERQMWESNHL